MKKILMLFVIAMTSICAMAADGYTHYKGNLGPYAITLKLKTVNDGSGFNHNSYKGSYTYTKAGNTLYLNGETNMMNGSEILLTETTAKGKVSADWVLHYTNSGLSGTMTVRKDNKTYNVKLTRTR